MTLPANHQTVVEAYSSPTKDRRADLFIRAEQRDGRSIAIAEAACLLVAEAGFTVGRATLTAATLHHLGQLLHRSFERACDDGNYTDAMADRDRAKFDRDLDSLSLDLVYDPKTSETIPSNVTVEVQTDPRGWPLILRTGTGRTCRLGGRDD